MTVKELVEKLAHQNPNAEACIIVSDSREGRTEPVEMVRMATPRESEFYENAVILET